MSIIIKGMDMPRECTDCPLYYECKWQKREVSSIQRADNCPLIEIVTCKECKHRFYEDMCDCIDILPGTEDDFFCPYAERRKDESNH